MKRAFLMSWLMIIFLLLVHEIVLASLITTSEELTDTGLRGVSANVIQLPDGNRRMYYMGTGGMVSAISSDGINWIQESGQRLSPEGNERMVTNPWVLYTNDGRFRMIYEGQDSNGNRRLYSAISTDGLNFTREGMVMGGTSVDINPQSNTIFLSVPTGLRLRQMASVRLDVRDLKAWELEKTFIAKRMAKGLAPGGRRWKREDAYEERLTRYGR